MKFLGVTYGSIPARAFDPALYPGSSGVSKGQKWGSGFAAALMILFAGTQFFVKQTAAKDSQYLAVIFAVAFLAMGIYFLVKMQKLRADFFVDRIVVQNVFSTQEMRRDDIQGIRRIRSGGRGNSYYYLLVPKSADIKPVKLSSMLEKNEAYYSWLGSLPNLDELDRQKSEQEIENDAAYGGTRDERLETLKNARNTAKIIEGVSIAVGAWCLIYPEPYMLLAPALIALPLIAILLAIRSNGLFSFYAAYKNSARPSFTFALLAPALGLVTMTIAQMHIVDVQQALLYTAAIGLAFSVLMIRIDPAPAAMRAFIMLFLSMAAYGFGTTGFINALQDKAPAHSSKIYILCKRYTNGRHPHALIEYADNNRDDFTPAAVPQGSCLPSVPQEDSEEVSTRIYNAARVGQNLCKTTHAGLLGIAWFQIDDCAGTK